MRFSAVVDAAGEGTSRKGSSGAVVRPASALGAVEDCAEDAVGAHLGARPPHSATPQQSPFNAPGQPSNRRQLLQSRCFVWTILGLAALGLMIAPFFDDTPCMVDAWRDHPVYKEAMSPRGYLTGDGKRVGVPSVGTWFGLLCATAVILAVLLDPQGQFDPEVALHIWVRPCSWRCSWTLRGGSIQM